MAISGFSRGMGRVSLRNWAEVMLPDSTNMYAVEMGSSFMDLITGAATTWSPIRLVGLRPLTSDKNKKASAKGEICRVPPGKMIAGKEQLSLMLFINSSKM